MKINIKGGGSGKGYGNYILRENKKDIDFSKIKTLSGDMQIGDEIVNSSNYKDNAFNIILEFKGKISDKKAKQVTDEFEELFMYGFEKEEYYLDAVLHQDTDNSHVHIRIPKKNLLTDTTLRLYMDNSSPKKESKDRKRLNLIRDYIEEKYNLEKMKDNLRLQPTPRGEVIQKWREYLGQKPFNFKTKKGRLDAQNDVSNYMKEQHEAGFIDDINDVRSILKDIGLKPSDKQGHDHKGDFYYITVEDEDESGKIRLKGELFNEQFYEYKREDRETQIRANTSTRRSEQGNNTNLQRIEEALKRSLDKRHQEITKRYETSRATARERYRTIQTIQPKKDKSRAEQEQQPLQHHTSDVNNDISITSISNISSSKKLEREANSERLESTTEAQIYKQKREKVYNHRSRRDSTLSRQKNLLYPNRLGGISGTDRNTTSRHGTTAEREPTKRTSSYEQFSKARESLYSQARTVVQDRANTRATRTRTRGQYSEAINRVGEKLAELTSTVSRRYEQINRESADIIQSAKEFTRIVEQKLRPQQEQHHSYGMRM